MPAFDGGRGEACEGEKGKGERARERIRFVSDRGTDWRSTLVVDFFFQLCLSLFHSSLFFCKDQLLYISQDHVFSRARTFLALADVVRWLLSSGSSSSGLAAAAATAAAAAAAAIGEGLAAVAAAASPPPPCCSCGSSGVPVAPVPPLPLPPPPLETPETVGAPKRPSFLVPAPVVSGAEAVFEGLPLESDRGRRNDAPAAGRKAEAEAFAAEAAEEDEGGSGVGAESLTEEEGGGGGGEDCCCCCCWPHGDAKPNIDDVEGSASNEEAAASPPAPVADAPVEALLTAVVPPVAAAAAPPPAPPP